MDTYTVESFLALVRAGIGRSETPPVIHGDTKWSELLSLSYDQGVVAVVADGAFCYYDSYPQQLCTLDSPELELVKYELLGTGFAFEQYYQRQRSIIAKLAEFYSAHGIKMMLLKGYGLSLLWPRPEHRPIGDIDIYLYGKWREADRLVSEVLSICVDNGHHHHSVFTFEGETIENHYDFVNVQSHRSNRAVEGRLKQLALSDKNVECDIDDGISVYFPSPLLNVLFVARHGAAHFAAGELTIRQILDWAFLAQSIKDEDVWADFWKDVASWGMDRFVAGMSFFCIDNLGFTEDVFKIPENMRVWKTSSEGDLVLRRMYGDILSPEWKESRKPDSNMFRSWLWMFRRWWHNRWKHKLVYSDSLFSTFVFQVIAHIAKPASLK